MWNGRWSSIQRQIKIVGTGGRVIQETLLWDADAGMPRIRCVAKGAHDYRYFPDPDLVPVLINNLEKSARAALPEFARPRRNRYESVCGSPVRCRRADGRAAHGGLLRADTHGIAGTPPGDGAALAKPVSNWVMTDVLRIVAEQKVDVGAFPIAPARLQG